MNYSYDQGPGIPPNPPSGSPPTHFSKNTNNTNSANTKEDKNAKLSMIIGIIGVTSPIWGFIIGLFVGLLSWIPIIGWVIGILYLLFGLAFFFVLIFGLILGIRSRNAPNNKGMAISGIIMNGLCLFVSVSMTIVSLLIGGVSILGILGLSTM